VSAAPGFERRAEFLTEPIAKYGEIRYYIRDLTVISLRSGKQKLTLRPS
jgi:hypothetical protein